MDRNRISRGAAALRVGRAIYGDEWIGGLTQREKWLIARYVEGSIRPEHNSPYKIGYIILGCTWAEYPSDQTLVAEVARAYDKNDWRKSQWREVYDWLGKHGFDLKAESVDADALALKISVNFRHNSTAPVVARARVPKKRGPKPIVTARLIKQMKADLTKGYDLESAKEEELKAKYDANRETCRDARDLVLSENVAK